MQFLLDNISATIIASLLFLVLVGVNHRSQQSAVTTTGYYTMKKQQLGFAEVIERDMQNIMEVTGASASALTFRARIDSVTVQDITYELVPTSVSDGTQLYQIQRTISGETELGGSLSTVRAWNVQLLNAAGALAGTPADARQIAFRFETDAAFARAWAKEGETSGERNRSAVWQATFRPPMLQESVL